MPESINANKYAYTGVETYDPTQVTMTVAGKTITGFGEGTYITVRREEDQYITHVGAQGEVSRTKNANNVGVIEVTLKLVAPANALLAQLANSDGLFTASVTDSFMGTTIMSGSKCWMSRSPDKTFGDRDAGRTWQITVSDLTEDYTVAEPE